MDRLVGAFGVDTAEFAHQQTGDDRGDGVGDFIRQHQGHHQDQTENRVRSLAVGRRSVIDLNRHIEHHEIPAALRQQGNLPPVADHQQDHRRAGVLHAQQPAQQDQVCQ